MPAYAYTGLDARGKTVKAIESADNVGALKAVLKRRGVYLTAVSESSGGGRGNAEADASGAVIDLSRFRDRVTPRMIADMTQQLATLLCAGVTLPESLQTLTDQNESVRFKGILSDVADRVNQGSSLADALKEHDDVFESLYVNMVRAGEASGALETVLLRVAEFMDKQLELRGKLSSAMIYPIIMAVIGAGLVALLMINVVPKITGMFEDMNAELPWNTKLLILFSDALSGYWFLFILAGIGLGWAMKRYRASEAGRLATDTLFLRLPIVGPLVLKASIARFASTLSTMLASGVQLLQALDIVRVLLGNVVLEKVVTDARDAIREGEGIAPALRSSGRFPPMATHMIAVGERSGQLEQMLQDVAKSYERETDAAITKLTASLEPLMIVLMGGAVAFVVFSIMQPIMQLNQMAGR